MNEDLYSASTTMTTTTRFTTAIHVHQQNITGKYIFSDDNTTRSQLHSFNIRTQHIVSRTFMVIIMSWQTDRETEINQSMFNFYVCSHQGDIKQQ